MLEVRRYQDSDHDVIWDLHILGLNQFDAHVGNGSWDADMDDVQGHYIENGGEFLVGIYADKVVCMGALRKESDTLAEIKRMRVHPDYQERGFGQIILDKLEKIASQLGYKELCLDTITKQIPARQLYEKNGYSEIRRAVVEGLEVIFYQKKLV